ncbi:hypothetical protein V8C35DRAFT_86508 [Trichoderma chlorosporum]
MSPSSAIPLQPEMGGLGLGIGAPSTTERHKSDPAVAGEKRAMASGRPLSSPFPSKLSRRRATSQVASPIVDFDVAIAEKPYNQPEEEPKSYYIINPKVPGQAWYVTRDKSKSNALEYEVEKVPAHLVRTRQNRIGYLFETAVRDDVTAALGGQPVSLTPKCQNGCSTPEASSIEKAHSGTKEEPGKRVNRFERCDLDGDVKPQLHNEPSIIVEHRDIPIITKRIIRQLYTIGLKQTRSCITKTFADQDEASLNENMELENAIRATLMEFRRSVHFSDTPVTNENASAQSAPPFTSESQHQRTKPRPSGKADPALTLSIPQTSSCSKNDRTKEDWQHEASTWTTVVSPQSATSPTWLKNGGHLGILSPDSADMPLDDNSMSTLQIGRSSSFNEHEKDEDLETSQASLGSSSIASTITSFPKLLSRHCTREWIKPLASLEDTSTDPSRRQHTLYTETQTPMGWPGDGYQSLGTSSYFTDEAAHPRRATASQPSLRNPKSFGTHIGSAAHRRRSAPTYDAKEPPSRDNFFPDILGRFFVRRSREEPGSPDSKKTADSPNPTLVGSPESRYFSFTRHASTSSAEEGVRIYDVLVESSAAADRRHQRSTCSEDGRPHICEDDLDNRAMTD